MLAALLRRTLLVLVLVGLGLGLAVSRAIQASVAITSMLVVLGAILVPVLVTVWLTSLTVVRSRGPGSARVWWRSLVGECVASLRVFLLRQAWAASPPAFQKALAQPERIPVLLVHGYICNHRVWDDLARDLRRAGHPVMTVNLEPVFTSIDNYAPLIEAAVGNLCHETGAAKVALVGHSMGGLAIRAWMRRHGGDRVARVITLGTPHVGTRVDPHPVTANSRQMVLNSPWLQELAASESPATRSLIRIALSTHDNIVYPQRQQVLEGASVTVFDGLGHLELVLDARARQWVLQQLEGI
jgi:triacylglycerol lipase